MATICRAVVGRMDKLLHAAVPSCMLWNDFVAEQLAVGGREDDRKPCKVTQLARHARVVKASVVGVKLTDKIRSEGKPDSRWPGGVNKDLHTKQNTHYSSPLLRCLNSKLYILK